MAESRYYLTTGRDPGDSHRLIAVISLGSPQLGDETVTVCDATSVATMAEAKVWFEEQLKLRPWEVRQ